MLRPFFILLFLYLHTCFVFSQYEKQIQTFINTPGLEHASIGFCVKDYDGKVVVSHNADQSYTPASILKIVTTASALELLGADFRYETIIGRDKSLSNRLIIIGSGDPTLGTEFLDNNPKEFINSWAGIIAKSYAGGQSEKLDMQIIDNVFGYQGVSRKWIFEDTGNYYASAAYGISVFDNTYRLSFNTENVGELPKIVETVPEMKDIRFVNTLQLNTTGKDNGYIVGAPFSAERTIMGDIPSGRKKFTIKGAMPDPGLYLGEEIARALKDKGINVNKVETSRSTYYDDMYKKKALTPSVMVIHKHLSPKLVDIVQDINVRSNNHYAEHLIRVIGASVRTDSYSPALEEGVEAISSLWESKQLQTDALFMYDGSGLAPTNAISPSLMCDILVYMQTKSNHAEVFLHSLPVAGRDGTVRSFLKDTTLEGKVLVKSGSIGGVQCFAGYYIDGEKKYTFSIMVNKFNGNHRQVVKAIENLLLGTLK